MTGPAAKQPVATASLVAVGKENAGPTPHTNALAFDGEKKVSRMISPRPVTRSPPATTRL